MPKSNVYGFVLVLFICGAVVPQAAFLNVSSHLPTGHQSNTHTSPSDGQQVQQRQSSSTSSGSSETKTELIDPPQPGSYPDSQEGIIDPRLITQSATYIREWEDLHTDADQNASISLDINRAHNWVGQKMNVEISDLQRQFIANGTFDEGINGTNIDGVGDAYPFGWSEEVQDAGWGQTQRTSYLNDSKYIVVENEGRIYGDEFRHYEDTVVAWNQTVNVERYTEQFYLRFNFLYHRGPLYNWNYRQTIYVAVWFNEIRVWRYNLIYLDYRDYWYSSSLVGIEFPIEGSLNFRIGIYYRITNDFDPANPACGSEENARFVTLFLDNVTLTPVYPPYPTEVNLQVHTPETGIQNITDISRGNGECMLIHEYWENDQIFIEFSSNASLYFTCQISLLVLNFRNSTITTNLDDEGVKYKVSSDSSVNLTLWTEVTYPISYTSFWFNVTFPTDWENITIYDSFPSDVTSSCYIDSGTLKINGSIAAQLGWWKIEFQAPNYAKSLSTQVFDSNSNDWENEDTFRCSNETRVIGDIGSVDSVPSPLVNINVTWVRPNGSIWSQAIFDGAMDGSFTSPSRWLDQTNSSAGEWIFVLFWANGSEIAFDIIEFKVIHGAKLSPYELIIEAQPGYPIVSMVYYIDVETNEPILDETALVSANWSGLDIFFVPNPVNQWWEGEFDTNLVDPGKYLLCVNASQPFYDDAGCTFSVKVLFSTRLTSPNAPWNAADWGEIKSLELHYEFFNTTTEPPHSWEGIPDTNPPTIIWCNWSVGYWTLEPGVPGEYMLFINTSALPMETWSLNITAVKDGYHPRQLTIDLLKVPLEIYWHRSSIYAIELVDFNFSLSLVESDTQRLVTGATIHFDFFAVRDSSQQESVIGGDLKEITNGVYEATVSLPLGSYILRVEVSESEYYSGLDESINVVVQQNISLRQGQYIGILVILVILAISGFVSTGALRKRRAASQQMMLAARQEFEDARNIVAIVITYKRSGTPIFTTQIGETVRGELLAGFLTAISHLRKEIINHEASDEFTELIPLSDVMLISPTQSTYCALITLMPPSPRLREKLVDFRQIIIDQYDDLLHQRESYSIERVIPTTIAEVVNKVFGLRHLAPHLSTFDGRPSWKFRYLARTIKEFFPTGKNIDLITLARHMQHQGKREKYAYYIIQQAIKEGYLVALPLVERILDNQLLKSPSQATIGKKTTGKPRSVQPKRRTRKK